MIYLTLSKLRTAHWALLSISIDKQQHWQITDCSLNFGNLLNENWIYRRCPSQHPLPLNSHSMRPNQNRMEGLVIFILILVIIKSTSPPYTYILCIYFPWGVFVIYGGNSGRGWSESLPASLPSPEQCKFYDPKSRDCQTIHSNHTKMHIKSVKSIMHQYGENKHRKNCETALSPGRPGMPCGLSNPGFHEVKSVNILDL